MWSLQKQEEACSSQLGLDKYHTDPYESCGRGQSQAGGQQKVFPKEQAAKYGPSDLKKRALLLACRQPPTACGLS